MEKKKISEDGSKDWIVNNLLRSKKYKIKSMKSIFHHRTKVKMMRSWSYKAISLIVCKNLIAKMIKYLIKVMEVIRVSSQETNN
jgi:hypothetical protein